LTELRKWTTYAIRVSAYTRAGDGQPSSPAVRERTFEDVPGAPSNVSFPDVSFTTARVIWDVPAEPNGEIVRYRVSYRRANLATSVTTAKDDNFTREFLPTDRTFRAVGLQPMTSYAFEVAARTSLGWGYAARGLVYTTNNREAPQPPSAPRISPSQVQAREITFSWNPGSDGYAPLRHYVVQLSRNGGGWQTVPEPVDPAVTSYTVTDLEPAAKYKFRLQAVNDIGPSGETHFECSRQTFDSQFCAFRLEQGERERGDVAGGAVESSHRAQGHADHSNQRQSGVGSYWQRRLQRRPQNR